MVVVEVVVVQVLIFIFLNFGKRAPKPDFPNAFSSLTEIADRATCGRFEYPDLKSKKTWLAYDTSYWLQK
jgi:hypothetical protein